MSYVLVDNATFDVMGIYYGGQNEKYHDMFNITIEAHAKKFDTISDAHKLANHLNRGGYAFRVQENSEKTN